VPSGSPGANADGLAQVREAYKLLNDVLPKLPIGSDPYNKVSQIIQQLVKLAPPGSEVPGVQATQMRNVMQNAGKNAMLQHVLASMGGGAPSSGGANAGAGMPGAPPMGAGAPPAMPGA
jgi:hypothetical protein